MSRRRGLWCALTVTALMLTVTPSSPAAALPGPSTFARGIVDQAFGDTSFNWPLRAEQIGASMTRLTINWAQVAPLTLPASFHAADPADPHYTFVVADAFVKAAVAHQQRVLLMVQDAPRWAEQSPPASFVAGTWRPNPAMLGSFAHALALRYSGHFPDPAAPHHSLPQVSLFQAWNEPNIALYLNPQWTRSGRSFAPASPILYRRMLNAFYFNVKAVQPTAQVLSAGTAPFGDAPGGSRIPPVEFLRELLCLHGRALAPERCPDPAHLDIVDHHPYGPTPTASAFSPDDAAVPDLTRLQRVLRRAVQLHRVLPRRSKPIWVTEIGWITDPPDSSPTNLTEQARYVPLTFYLLWRQGVNHVLWISLRDDKPGGIAAAGLYFNNGRAKPSAGEYKFPFLALHVARGSGPIWGIAPRRGTVLVQERSHRGWRTIATLGSNRAGIFYARRHIPRHALLRAAVGSAISPSWSTG